jgi:putative tryptophan/tyrosine transport system substrate-binding protein
VVAVVLNPNNPNADSQLNDVQTAARILGQPIVVVKASTDRDLEAALAALVQQQINAFAVTADSFLFSRQNEMLAFAGRHRLPTMGVERQFELNGGLMTYGPDSGDAFRHAGVYTGRILNGERPADLPVMQPTKFELLINLKTANRTSPIRTLAQDFCLRKSLICRELAARNGAESAVVPTLAIFI